MKILGMLFLAISLISCSSTNLAEVVKALGTDPANVCISVSTVYGVASFARVMAVNAEVSCPQGGGMTVRSLSSTTIPVTVTPQPAASPVQVQIVPTP